MKFIRDIIGEKRQMDGHANGTQADTSTSGIVADDILTKLDQQPEAQSSTVVEPTPQQHDRMDIVNDNSPEIDSAFDIQETSSKYQTEAIDDILEAVSAEQSQSETADVEIETAGDAHADPVDTPFDAKPTKLVPGKSAAEPKMEMMSETPLELSETPIEEMVTSAMRADHDPVSETLDMAEEQTEPEQETSTVQVSNATVETSQTPAPEIAETISEPVTPSMADPKAFEVVDVPQPAVGRASARNGRVKTRLLGFNSVQEEESDPISDNTAANSSPCAKFPVGWLIVTDGPGRGSAFTLFNGVSKIGRGQDQTVPLDFGDNSISRENHAAIAYDPEQKSFYIGHGGKTNLVRKNERPILSTEELSSGDRIKIGETTLRLVALCGPDFNWDGPQENGSADVRNN